MKTAVDDTLRAEALRFAFRFCCDDCAHFEPRSELCSLTYPAAPRRGALEHSHIALCKTFELG